MAEAVRSLPEDIQSLIEIKEWDLRTVEGVARCRELKIKSLPTLALDGEAVYNSIIPEQEELINEIKSRSMQ